MFKAILASKLYAKGFCMGVADLIPGVSGGTVAFMLGIYHQFISAIKSFDRIWFAALLKFDIQTLIQRPHFHFLIPLGLGILSALLFFTHIISLPSLIEHYPKIVYGLFFGLILATVIVLLNRINYKAIISHAVILFLLGLSLGWLLLTKIPEDTPNHLSFIILCGFLSMSAMLLPGVSGSFVLLIMNKYSYMLTAVKSFDLAIIMSFILGMILAVIIMSRFILFFLNHYYQQTILFMSGLLTASLWAIWPFQEKIYDLRYGKPITTPIYPSFNDQHDLLSCALMIAGFLLVIVIEAFMYKSHKHT